jgi:uncharacterized membrane protein HdeD (DUF308 family)
MPVLKSTATTLILRGVLALIVGIIALAWPGVTVLVLVIMFAVFAFTDAALQAVRGFSTGKAGPVVGHLLLSLIDMAAGVVALAWPLPTALVLVLIAAVWAVAGGFFEFFSAFTSGLTAGNRALDIVTGLLLVAFGVLLFARPGVGAVTFALLFGLFSLVYGITQIMRGAEVRGLRRDLHAVGPHVHAESQG